MPVIFHMMNGSTIATRGERLGIIRRIMFRCGIPIAVKAYQSNDRYIVRPRVITHAQEITDETAEVRKRAAAGKADGKKPGPTMMIPSGK